MASNIFEFKISLLDTNPLIWRRIQLPADLTFEDLHLAVRDAMGWHPNYQHLFYVSNQETKKNVIIGVPKPEFGINPTPEKQTKITQYFSKLEDSVIYEYALGDSWQHEILLEKILQSQPNVIYPKCLAGERACPPDDVGGVDGFNTLIEILSNPEHEEYDNYYDWLHNYMGYKNYKVEVFNPSEVNFTRQYAKS